jgi:putative DNA primase/helicase
MPGRDRLYRRKTGAERTAEQVEADLRARYGVRPNPPRVEWPDPEPLQGELPPVQAFDPELLPESLREFAEDVAERMQVPLDFVAAMLVLCLAGAVNRRASIQPKAVDTSWIVVPNLWGGVVAESGLKKSPTLKAITRPLERIQALWHQEYAAALDDYEHQKEEQELRQSAWKQQYKHAHMHNKPVPIRPDDSVSEPKLRRLVMNDATYEKMHEAMQQNPAGILVVRDELTGWLAQLDRQGREGEREFALQAWNGDTGHVIDRIGRGTVYAPYCCMSLMGGIQPDRLRSYLADTLAGGPTNDGLIPRFQVLVWPDVSKNPVYVDRAPNAAAEQRVARIFSRLVDMEPEMTERLRFAPDAQELFVEWFVDLERRLASNELHPALVSHLSKYRSLMPSLALLFEWADAAAKETVPTCVSLAHGQQAANWCDYLESHARRIYSCVVTPQFRAAQILSQKIREKKIGADGIFSIRDVYLKGWTGLDTPETAKAAANILEDAGWIRSIESESPDPLGRGRPANRYQINPKVWA